MKFHTEVEITPLDLSKIRMGLKNYPLEKMAIGDFCRIYSQENQKSIIYQIKRVKNQNSLIEDFEIKKFIFNKGLFDSKAPKIFFKTEAIWL